LGASVKYPKQGGMNLCLSHYTKGKRETRENGAAMEGARLKRRKGDCKSRMLL